MGRPKLSLTLPQGGRLLDRPAAALRATCARLRIVGALPAGLTAPDGYAALADAAPAGSGPLAGLLAALEEASEGWVLLCAGDLPEVDAALLARLQDEAERTPELACLPEGPRGPEPALSAWPVHRAAEVRARFEAGERALHRALPDDAMRGWQGPEVDRAAAADAFRNLNTPQDWQAWSGIALPGA